MTIENSRIWRIGVGFCTAITMTVHAYALEGDVEMIYPGGTSFSSLNINDYEALSAALVQAGVGELNQIQSGVDDEAQLKMAALEAAARDARTRALAVTNGLGVELGMPVEVGENQLRPLLNFQQGNASGRALDQIFMSAERRGAAELPPLFVPGNIKVSATVWVVFELLSE